VALSDGSIVHFREIPRSDVPGGDTLEASCYQTVLRLARQNAEEIDRRYPKIMRRVGGYNLDEFTAPEKPVNLARIMVGSEGTLGVVLEAKLRLVPLPKAKAVMVVMFADLLESLAAAPVILRHNPSAVEVMDKSILDHTRQNANLDLIRNKYIEGDPAATYASSSTRIQERTCRRACKPRRRSAHAAPRLCVPCRDGSRGTGPCLEPARSFAGPFHGDEGDAKSIAFVEDTAVAPSACAIH
jgi:hypothetical protein